MAYGNTKREILGNLKKARKGLFPTKTCPASRHVHLIVEGLLDSKEGYGADLARIGYEPEHMAGSIASVLEGLWEARRFMEYKLNVEGDYTKGGRWLPNPEAVAEYLAAQGIETPVGAETRNEVPSAG